MSEIMINTEQDTEGYKVTLPCKPEEFTDFVSSLLGKGLTIEKNYNDIYKLDAPSLQQLFFLITQRANQNAGELVSFNSKLYFSDKSSISFNSPEDLFSHNEIKKIVTRRLFIEMTYLIHFPGHQAPEKQTVAITFKPGDIIRHRGAYLLSDESEINLQVHHSEKTWANDVINLFNDFLSNHKYEPNRSTLLWNKLNQYVSGLAGFLCFGVGLLGIVVSYNFISSNLAVLAEKSLGTQTDAVKYLVLQSYDTSTVNFVVASVFYVGVLIFLSVFTAEKLENKSSIPVESMLVFTNEDKKIADSKEKKSNFELFGLSFELIKGILVGIVANVVFSLIWY